MQPNALPTLVNGAPMTCSHPHGALCHQHPGAQESCPVVERWYCGPRYGQMDYAIVGATYWTLAGYLTPIWFEVRNGEIVRDCDSVPIGVLDCLARYVRLCREAQPNATSLLMVSTN